MIKCQKIRFEVKKSRMNMFVQMLQNIKTEQFAPLFIVNAKSYNQYPLPQYFSLALPIELFGIKLCNLMLALFLVHSLKNNSFLRTKNNAVLEFHMAFNVSVGF